MTEIEYYRIVCGRCRGHASAYPDLDGVTSEGAARVFFGSRGWTVGATTGENVCPNCQPDERQPDERPLDRHSITDRLPLITDPARRCLLCVGYLAHATPRHDSNPGVPIIFEHLVCSKCIFELADRLKTKVAADADAVRITHA